MALVVVRHCAAPALLPRKPRLRAVRRLDPALLVEGEHDRPLRRVRVQPHHVRSFSTNSGSVESLKVRARWGFSPCARQIRATWLWWSPAAPAIRRVLQCVPLGGSSSSVRRTTSAVTVRGRPRRGRSSSPATPLGPYRSSQRLTVRETPTSRRRARAERPSAEPRTILARSTRRCGVLRARTQLSSSLRRRNRVSWACVEK